MKKRLISLYMACLVSGSLLALDSADSTGMLRERQNKKLIKVYRAPSECVLLELYKPGSIHILQKTTALGSMVVEADGIRFIPTTKSPEGYIPQEQFDRIYWYNHILKEVYIPFSNIKSVNSHYGTVRTKDGRKYKFYCKRFRDRFGNTIREKIET